MHVVATAGHVDHGKSSLVRALTGRDPDRYAEEKRRGLTIDLGFAWTTLPSGADLAFVDVPGHQRFVPTMLAGVGPVPAVMFVVAADEGWQPQSEEHLAAVDALGAATALLVVTKCDRADPGPALDAARCRLAETSLAGAESVAVSIHDAASLEALRGALDRLVGRLPPPPTDLPVRLWVDRAFTIRGAGTVVTGTLGAGRVRVGDELVLVPSGRRVTVRGLQSQERSTECVEPVSRVAVNLRGVDHRSMDRGSALVSPGCWTVTDSLDVGLACDAPLPAQAMLHVGSAAVAARPRRLGGQLWRLRLDRPLPLHVNDRVLLRDPSRRLVLSGADVLDVRPPPLRGHGAAAMRAASLAGPLTADADVDRRGHVTVRELAAAGHQPPTEALRIGDRWVSRGQWDSWRAALQQVVGAADPASRGLAIDELRQRLGVPDGVVVTALLAADPGLVLADGFVTPAGAAATDSPAMVALRERLARDPLDAPAADELDIERSELARAVRRGDVLDLGHGVYVGESALDHAAELLRHLPGPFTMSEARQALGTSRRVAVPLLERMDALRRTRRLDHQLRVLLGQPEP